MYCRATAAEEEWYVGNRLEGRTAIVTGAGQGIGRGIALAVAKEGAGVALVGRTGSKLDKVRAEIEAVGGAATAVVADISERVASLGVVDRTVAEFGGVDIVVNNAQDSVQRRLEDTTDEDVARAYTTGPLATLYMMQAALPHLKQRGGSVVNFGSSTALLGEETFGSYAMAKEAIRGLTRVAAREWGRYGIRVNSICPASLSPSAEAWAQEHPKQFAHVLRTIPMGRMGDPEHDIGRAVVGLVSDDLQYLTGATLVLEGGRVIIH
jgi:NAD(P)-dependent dehydrogenase (short-subunit alcohol dehydrogenase family)